MRAASGEPMDPAAGQKAAPIPRQPRQESYAPSYSQRGAWLREQLYSGLLAYNAIRVVELSGPLAAARLRAAMQALVDRFDVLRARFTCPVSEPMQSFADFAVALPCADLSALGPGAQTAAARRLLRRTLEVPFELEVGPLFRFHLLRLARERHLLLLSFHHLVVDGVSYGQIVQEVMAFYQGRPLPPPRLQFQDFAAWQMARIQSGELEASRRYWMERLGGDLPVLELPADRPRPASPSYAGASVLRLLPAAPRDALAALARTGSTTFFRAFCAAFKVFLHRLTGATDIIIGSPFAGRTHPDLADQIGFFVTTLALRTDLGGDPDFTAALARVSETVAGAKRHQDFPFEKLLEQLAVDRDLSRSPVYSVALLQRPLTEARRFGDLLLSHWEYVPDIAPYEFMATEAETATGVQVLFNYRPELFDRTTVERWAESFVELLRGAAASPRTPISELSLLRAAERHQLLMEWGAAAPESAAEAGLAELFEHRAEHDPDAVAVIDGETRLSYGEVNRRANQLAHRLRAIGVAPESLVALLLERVSCLVWAILGVLKAGGAYLPLERADPESRLLAMIDDARPAVLLCDRPVPPALARPGLAALELTALELAGEATGNPPPWADPDSLAYVIYTSGSTGGPKGTPICHRNVTRLFRATEHWFGFGREDVWTLFHSTAFDFSVWELWGALLYGGRLVIVPYLVSRSPEELHALLVREGVTVLNQTPSAFRQLVASEEQGARANPGQRLALRLVIFGGEALDMASVEAWFERHGDCQPRLVNMYGITETTVHVTYRALAQADLTAPWRKPIGRAIPDLEIYLHDRRGQPVPAGVPGEILVGGAGLSRGYRGRPELTAERFVPHPYAARPGERLYRSGDLARRLPDGQLDYLGRIDHQVKMRGFRIELGEIEAALAELTGVRAAVVLPRHSSSAGQRLVAYVVVERGVSPGELSRRLAEKLPPYMVPAFFVQLESLPLTRNGKVDRAALELLDLRGQAGAERRREPIAPGDPVQAKVARIWEEVLEVEPVGVDDDFFELGGHSLLATRVVARLREAFKRELSVRSLFEAPTVARLARLIAVTVTAAPPPIGRADRPHLLPLSFAQQRLWFLDQLAPGTASYNIPAAWLLRGPLAVPALARGLAAVVRRHEILRTRFPAPAGLPVQEILPPAPPTLPVIDLGRLDPERGSAELRLLSAREAMRPFALAGGPLLRVILVRLAQREAALLVTLHHIVADGWSLGVFLADLAASYAAETGARADGGEARREADEERAERPAAPPELPFQYADFALWQRQWLRGEVLAAQLDFWRRQLAGAATLELTGDRPRPAVQLFRGGVVELRLPAATLQGLHALARRHGATLYMTLLAAFQTALHRYTGQTDIVVGSPIANRHHPGLEGLIGLFANTLALRGDLAGDPGFDELLERVGATALAAFAHQDLPFEKLVEQLQPERDPRRNPIFQVVLAVHYARAVVEMTGLAVEPLAVYPGTTRFDLELYFRESPDGLHGSIVYDRALFDRVRIARLAEHLASLLSAITADSMARLSQLPLLAAAERHQLLEWAGSPLGPPVRAVVHELFEAQVERTPAAVAVESAAGHLTYAGLNRRANQLAHHLARRGIGTEARVGVFLGPSLEMVVAILAILKAGGAYLSLDPAQGEERLRFMLDDAGVPLLLTRAELAAQLPALPAGRPVVVWLDREGPRIARESAANPSRGVTPQQLAYVLYTSGSTGRPKGAEIPHRAIPGVTCGVDYADFSARQTWLQHSSIAWDALTLEVWAPLLNGGRCVLAGERLLGGEEIEQAIAANGVTAMFITSSLFNAVMDTHPEAFADLAQLLVGGEALSVPHSRQAQERFPSLRLVNGYGPSECTVFTACHPLPGRLREGEASVPLGRPVGDRRVYLLDRSLQLVPVGVAGELCVAGESVARGYLQRPQLTAERFVPDPLSGTPGGRLYRTGDLVRWRQDGLLDFVGRIDDQVKVRGIRVEPGEIEAALVEHPQVSAAAVLALPEPAGGWRLVAYVVPAWEQPGLEETLREHLGERLPGYMIPAAFVVLEEMPLTSHGKLDRQALPAPGEAPAAGAHAAPRNPLEARLAAIWREMLGVVGLGIDDDFFHLGGHSILATRVVSRIRRDLELELPLAALFEAPTVAGLARRIETARAPELPPIVRLPRGGELPLSFAQQRLWFFDRLMPQSALYNVAAAWRLGGALDVAALAAALVEIARRHEPLRTCFANRQGRPTQLVRDIAELPLPVIDLAALGEGERQAELRRLVRAEAVRPFDLGRGPILRTRLLRLGAAEHAFLLTVHHIAFDGWSSGIFRRELSALYDGFSRGERPPLAELPIRYADFACWQRRWLDEERVGKQLAYWRRQLAGTPLPLALPGDRPRPPVPSFRGAARELTLPPALGDALRAFGLRHGATVFMTLLAAFKALLHRYASEDDIVVGSPIANRSRSEIEPLIGFFANTLALRTDLGGDPLFPELLRRVSETALGAYMHQDIPFEKLVEELRPERELNRQPLFQVMLQLQNAPREPFGLAGLTLELLPPPLERCAFDLIVTLTEEPAGGLAGYVLYSTDLFDATAIARLAGHWRTLLAGAVAAGDRLSVLPLLTAAERQQLLGEGNDTRAEVPAGQCFHELFAAQAAQVPQADAVLFAGRRLSYRELDQRANQLAHHLRRRGVRPEVLVGFCLPRSLDLLVALLGILKAGGAYLPLDPDYPRERLAYMVADARVPLLVTERRLAERLPPASPARLLCLDEEAAVIAGETTSAPPCGATPENLAYAIYTSGSTGRPKAVLVPHRGLCSMAEAQLKTFALGAGDRLLQFSSPSFDAATFEIVMALRSGAALCLGSREELLPGPPLIRLLSERGVTAMLLPPSALAAVPAAELPALHTVFTAGEACSAELVDRWAAPRRRFFNLYGPTEATIWATWWRGAPGCRKPPIGRPIANAEAYLLDRYHCPVPASVPAELCIGGAGVSRGYLGRPALTAERFIPNPFAEEPGARLYRTGDLARFRADGELEFLGRIDHQVKIRGFRVEMGEVEAVLAGHPAVREAVVEPYEAAPGDLRLAAYFLAHPPAPPPALELRRFLQEKLPDYMVPSSFVPLAAWPLTASGKVDRQALAALRQPAPGAAAPASARPEAEETIAAIWRDLLQIEAVGSNDNFFDLGGHSLLLVRLQERLHQAFGREPSIVDLFQHPTVAALAEHLAGTPSSRPGPRLRVAARASAVAIIGMAGRFPGAADLDEFWHNLARGVESIRRFSDAEAELDLVDPSWLGHPAHVKAGGLLEGADLFDAQFFAMMPRDAEILDPQQRVFLETAWEALEDAGYDPATYAGAIGVFAGVQRSTYWTSNLATRPELLDSVGRFQAIMGNDNNFLASRVAYKLGLRGPAVGVQTACSTSLVAIHQACLSLRAGDSDLVLAGGVSIGFPQRIGYLYHEGGILSPDGHCRAFDARAGGSVAGSGVGVVVLKRLEQALADGDTIRAVVKGSAINNDGSLKVGYTAPSVQGQAEVIARAQAAAGVEAETIALVEAHGTGTELGDPIEVAALKRAFGPGIREDSCALGSVKTNIGHLDAAAGVAGFIKAVLAIEHEMLPPSLHFEEPNPRLELVGSPFYVNTRLVEWPPGETPRRAGVSSFGLGGTNAHVVLEQAPPPPPGEASRPWQLLVLSANTDSALAAASSKLAAHFRRLPQIDLADAAFTLQVGRQARKRRLALVCRSAGEAVAALASGDPSRVLADSREPRERPVAFLFPGQGVQYVGMGRDLYRDQPVFRAEIDRCAELLLPLLNIDLRQVLYPGLAGNELSAADGERLLNRTDISQPALVAFEIALASLWMTWGILPRAMIGHSVGEFTAACVAGVFTLEDALRLVVERGRIMRRLAAGAMLAVPLSEEETLPLLGEELSLASLNSPSLCVVSGAAEAVAALELRLAGREVSCLRLNVGPAGHSRQMDPLLGSFAAAVGRVRRNPPQIPFVSGVTGDWISAGEATDPQYWARHLRQTARFSPGLRQLLREPRQVLLEVGPGSNLSALALQHLAPGGEQLTLASLRHPQDLGPLRRAPREPASDAAHLLAALGRLWLAGVGPDWAAVHASERRRRIPLPTYPFERRRFWIAPAATAPLPAASPPSPAMTVPPAPASQRAAAPQAAATPGAALAQFLGRQLELMRRQLEVTSDQLALLRGGRSVQLKPPPAALEATAPLAPMQRWFFERALAAPRLFVQARLFEVPPGLAPELLETVLAQLLALHDALRLRFTLDGGGWRQRCADAPRVCLPRCDLAAVPATAWEEVFAAVLRGLAASLDLSLGPLLRAAFFSLGKGEPGRLLIVVHHLAVDITSWMILEEDLASACAALARGRPAPPQSSTPFLVWARRLAAYARSPELRAELAYWLAEPRTRVARLPLDHPGAANTAASARTVVSSLGEGETRLLLREVASTHGVLLHEAVLAAVAAAVAAWTGESRLSIEIEGHGREDLFTDVDLSRTVGWLTSPFPLLLELGDDLPGGIAKTVKEQIRRVPHGGIGFGVLRYLAVDRGIARRLAALPQPEILFNHLGRLAAKAPPSGASAGAAARLRPARERADPMPEPQASRFHLLEVESSLAGGRLELRWRYSANLHRGATIEEVARRALDYLRGMAAGQGGRQTAAETTPRPGLRVGPEG